MDILSLHLENYRCFEDFDIDFDKRLTVLVGTNGAGKTATLDALSVYLKQAGYPQNYNSPFYITAGDITIGRKVNELVYRIGVQARNATNEEQILLDIYVRDITQGDIALYMNYSKSYLRLVENEQPLCVAYLADRHIRDEDIIMRNSHYNPSADTAFEGSFTRTIDYASTLEWFNFADAEEAHAMRDRGLKEELPELRAVREALSKALMGKYEKPQMLGNPPELTISGKEDGLSYKVSQLSDGYRSMLALVMDLARRMAQARGNSTAAEGELLHTPAIVLIDEVELHLHPAWQQSVLTTLLDIFPNTQFIVTTHSPQVLTSIPPKHIRILSEGKAYTVDEQTQGAEASQLLKLIFGVDPRQSNLEIVKDLYDYTRMVYDEQWDTPEAEELRQRLSAHFGDHEAELEQRALHIENVKWAG